MSLTRISMKVAEADTVIVPTDEMSVIARGQCGSFTAVPQAAADENLKGMMMSALSRFSWVIRTLMVSALCALGLAGGTAMAIEEPEFTIVLAEGAFEVRDYPSLIAAEVSVGGARDEASSAGFRLLAGYIFGGNTAKESVAMTAPVVQERARGETIAMTSPVIQSGSDDAWIVRFIMPASYDLETLPTPNDPQVRLVTIPARRYAVVRFSGLARPAEAARRTADLESFMARHELRAVAPPSLARYDPPWTVWFMRRNEVWIELERME